MFSCVFSKDIKYSSDRLTIKTIFFLALKIFTDYMLYLSTEDSRNFIKEPKEQSTFVSS